MSQDNLEASTPRLSDVFGVKNSLEDALKLIMCNAEAYQKFQCFPPREQQKVLSFIAGQRGLKVTYDAFFMKIMSPHLHPERLESFYPSFWKIRYISNGFFRVRVFVFRRKPVSLLWTYWYNSPTVPGWMWKCRSWDCIFQESEAAVMQQMQICGSIPS